MTSSARRGRKKEDIVISPELKELLVKKQEEEDRLLTLEKQLYNLEEAYMQQTYHLGNVVKGWDGYLSTRAVNNLKAVHRRIKVGLGVWGFRFPSLQRRGRGDGVGPIVAA